MLRYKWLVSNRTAVLRLGGGGHKWLNIGGGDSRHFFLLLTLYHLENIGRLAPWPPPAAWSLSLSTKINHFPNLSIYLSSTCISHPDDGVFLSIASSFTRKCKILLNMTKFLPSIVDE